MRSKKVVIIGDKEARRYLQLLSSDSKRKTIYAQASAKAALPIRRTAREEVKSSLKHSSGVGRDGKARQPLAKFQERVSTLNSGRKDKLPPRKKKTINLIRVRRGKKKYRGGAWVVGGPLSNILHNSKGGEKRKSKNGKPIPIALADGTVIFTPFVVRPEANPFLMKAFKKNKGTTIRIWKAELSKAVAKHAKKNALLGGKSGASLRNRL